MGKNKKAKHFKNSAKHLNASQNNSIITSHQKILDQFFSENIIIYWMPMMNIFRLFEEFEDFNNKGSVWWKEICYLQSLLNQESITIEPIIDDLIVTNNVIINIEKLLKAYNPNNSLSSNLLLCYILMVNKGNEKLMLLLKQHKDIFQNDPKNLHNLSLKICIIKFFFNQGDLETANEWLSENEAKINDINVLMIFDSKINSKIISGVVPGDFTFILAKINSLNYDKTKSMELYLSASGIYRRMLEKDEIISENLSLIEYKIYKFSSKTIARNHTDSASCYIETLIKLNIFQKVEEAISKWKSISQNMTNDILDSTFKSGYTDKQLEFISKMMDKNYIKTKGDIYFTKKVKIFQYIDLLVNKVKKGVILEPQECVVEHFLLECEDTREFLEAGIIPIKLGIKQAIQEDNFSEVEEYRKIILNLKGISPTLATEQLLLIAFATSDNFEITKKAFDRSSLPKKIKSTIALEIVNLYSSKNQLLFSKYLELAISLDPENIDTNLYLAIEQNTLDSIANKEPIEEEKKEDLFIFEEEEKFEEAKDSLPDLGVQKFKTFDFNNQKNYPKEIFEQYIIDNDLSDASKIHEYYQSRKKANLLSSKISTSYHAGWKIKKQQMQIDPDEATHLMGNLYAAISPEISNTVNTEELKPFKHAIENSFAREKGAAGIKMLKQGSNMVYELKTLSSSAHGCRIMSHKTYENDQNNKLILFTDYIAHDDISKYINDHHMEVIGCDNSD